MITKHLSVLLGKDRLKEGESCRRSSRILEGRMVGGWVGYGKTFKLRHSSFRWQRGHWGLVQQDMLVSARRTPSPPDNASVCVMWTLTRRTLTISVKTCRVDLSSARQKAPGLQLIKQLLFLANATASLFLCSDNQSLSWAVICDFFAAPSCLKLI